MQERPGFLLSSSLRRLRLPEECIQFPELVLLPIVERMVVALRALHLQAQEQLGGFGRRIDAVILHVADQEIHSPLEIFLARLVRARWR